MNNLRRKFRVIFALILLLAAAAGCCTLTSCGQAAGEAPQWLQLRMPDGNIIEGYGSTFGPLSHGCITVTINGISYYTHLCNIVECSEKP